MSNILDFTKEKLRHFPVEEELCERIISLIHEYDGQIGVAAVLGILEIVKIEIIEDE